MVNLFVVMNGEWCERRQSWSISRYSSRIFLEEPRKTKNKLSYSGFSRLFS